MYETRHWYLKGFVQPKNALFIHKNSSLEKRPLKYTKIQNFTPEIVIDETWKNTKNI